MRRFITPLAILVLLVSCNKNDLVTDPEEDQLPVNISLSVATRVTEETYENGDAIGLYMVYDRNFTASGNYVDNNRYTNNSGAWETTNEISWKDKSSTADFYCYYPYGNVQDAYVYDFSVLQDQSVPQNFSASDFTWGKRTDVVPTANSISIATSHIMSNLHIYLKPGAGFTQKEFDEAVKTVKIGNVKTACTVNLSDGIVTAKGEAGEITPLPNGTHYDAIIVPQSVGENADMLIVTVDGVKYSAAYRFDFEARTQHKITVTVDKTSSGLSITIEKWIIDEIDHNVTIK